MKRAAFLVLAFCFVASLAFAQEAQTTETTLVSTEMIMLKGDIIDNKCAGSNKEDLANFVKTHTKECALMPACVASGYSIYADGKLVKFDAASNAKIEEFLKKTDSKLQVIVSGKKVGEELSLVSIENQS